jgi:hypothetical protein
MANHYYYYVSSLPNISLDDAKPAADLVEFREDVRAHVVAEDYRLVELLYLPDDHVNLLHILTGADKPWESLGNYNRETIEALAAGNPAEVPEYLHRFVTAWREEHPIFPDLSWEDQLATLFYEYLEQFDNHFIRTWFRAERTMRNILTALNCRQYQLPVEKAVIGHDELVESLVKSSATDFGLANTELYIDQLLRLRDNPDVLEREYAIDQLAWNLIDQINFFESFNIDLILGYLVRLRLAHRWLQLDMEKGQAKFRSILDGIDRSFTFGEEFTLEKRIRL